MHTTIITSMKMFILRFRILALHSNAILLFTSGEDVENREKNERRTNNIRRKLNWRTARVNSLSILSYLNGRQNKKHVSLIKSFASFLSCVEGKKLKIS